MYFYTLTAAYQKTYLEEEDHLRILLIEDEDITREIYKSHLHPHQVHAFDNGQSALEHIMQNAESVDLVISDHFMPMLNGLDLFYEIRRINDSIPFLLITGSPMNEALNDFIKKGGTLVTKPISLKNLSDLVNSYDRQEKGVCERTGIQVKISSKIGSVTKTTPNISDMIVPS